MSHCYNSIVIKAPINEVWHSIKDFHNMDWAEGVVTSIEKVGDKSGCEVGAKRIINNSFSETLISYDENEYSFSYTIDDGPGPVAKDLVSDYIGSVLLREITMTNSTFVEWKSVYNSADNESVAEFCNPIYIALLTAMAKYFEK